MLYNASREERFYDQNRFRDSGNYIGVFDRPDDDRVFSRIAERSAPLSEFAKPCSGYNPYETGKGQAPGGGPHTRETIKERPYHASECLGPEWKVEIGGRHVRRYFLRLPQDRWVKYGPWLAAPRDPDNFRGPRLLFREITGGNDRRIIATYCNEEVYHSRDVIPVRITTGDVHPFFLLGIVNSTLISWYHQRRSPKAQKELFPKVLVADIRNLPIPALDSSSARDSARHDRLVDLVQSMLDLHKQLAAAKTAHDKTTLQRQITATDHQIDQLVYELYGITEEEIRIVEEVTRR